MKTTIFLLLVIIFQVISQSSQTKKVNCRKYVYAPVCRGVAAKRALPRLNIDRSSKRETAEFTIMDADNPLLQWKDKDKDKDVPEKGLLQLLYKNMNPPYEENDTEDNYIK